MTRTLRFLISIAVLGLATVLPVSAAGASGPAISVAPSSGLTDGQTVTVSASGFTIPTPTVIGIEECVTGAPPPYVPDCDTSTAAPFLVNSDDYVENYTVVRHITTPNEGAVDSAAPNGCEILSGGAFPDTSQEAAAPISFTAPKANLNLENARLVHRVKPGEPVEIRVKAVNEGPTPTNWVVRETAYEGLTPVGATCKKGNVESESECTYSTAQAKVGHTVKDTFVLQVPVGYAGPVTDTICVQDTNANNIDPVPADNCATVSTNVE